MNIILVTDSYPPEIRSASNLMAELASGLRDIGNNVTVVTSYPRYNLDESNNNFTFKEFTVEEGVNIIRIKTLPHHKINFIIRGIAQITMPYIFFNKIKKYIKNIDAVLVYSPPLPLAIVGKKVKRYYKAKFILNVQDVFPQNAIDLGILKNKILIRYFKHMEYNAYKNADIVTVHSEGNLKFIKNEYSELAGKMVVLHNWIDIDKYDKVDSTGEYRERFGLDDKFVILFAGVIGPSQGLDFIINIAEKVKTFNDIMFLIVGDGMEKEKIRNMADNKGLENIKFMPFVSNDEYPKLVKDIDVGLVSLTNKNKTPVVPGKILGYMAAAKPVLAFLNSESDGHKLIKEAKCGYSSIWGDLEKSVNLLIEMYKNREEAKKLGYNGYVYVKENYSKKLIIKKIMEILD